MATLGCYFPTATVFGCDVDEQSFGENVAATRAGTYFHSSRETILAHGKFDIIFANSVLCAYPLRTTIEQEFSFERFEEWCGTLAEALNDGGLLVLFNSSYCARISTETFRPVRSPMIYSAGWVPKWSPDHQLMTDLAPGVETVFLRKDMEIDRHLDCLFETNARLSEDRQDRMRAPPPSDPRKRGRSQLSAAGRGSCHPALRQRRHACAPQSMACRDGTGRPTCSRALVSAGMQRQPGFSPTGQL